MLAPQRGMLTERNWGTCWAADEGLLNQNWFTRLGSKVRQFFRPFKANRDPFEPGH